MNPVNDTCIGQGFCRDDMRDGNCRDIARGFQLHEDAEFR